MRRRIFIFLLALAALPGCGGNGGAAPVEDLSRGDVARLNLCLDDSSCLFLGNVETTPPDPALPAELRAYGGRWEGYQLGTPTKDDIFLVVVFTEITEREAVAVLGMGQNPAQPMILERRRFLVAAAGGGYEIQSTTTVEGVGSDEVNSVRLVFRLDAGEKRLVHRAEKVSDPAANSEFVLSRNRNITVVRDMTG